MAKADLTAERLRELLHYDPDTGAFTWAMDVRCGHRREQLKFSRGTSAGGVGPEGYLEIGIQGKSYKGGRLAWLHYYGEPPSSKIAYVDGNGSNCAIRNLRLMGAPSTVTAERLRQVFDYDPCTGQFKWKICPGMKKLAGQPAGRRMATGYISLSMDGRSILAHRAAWLYVHGSWPLGVIDHTNGDRGDNRIANLRDVTHAANIQNQRRASRANKRSPLLGAHWYGRHKDWRSSIYADGKLHHLGYFDTDEEAHQAYLAAKRKLHQGCTI